MGLQLFPAGTSLAELENQITGKLNQWEKESGGEKKRCGCSSVGLGLLDISLVGSVAWQVSRCCFHTGEQNEMMD